jgi:release factor glutamine methyltransferase
VGVVPYVPTKSMSLLPRDTFVFESTLAYDGGDDGAEILRRVIRESTLFLRAGGALILELGGDEAEILQSDLLTRGFTDVNLMVDDDGDVRGLDATFDA